MNTLRLILLLGFMVSCLSYAQETQMNESRKAEIRILLYDFPVWAALARARSVLRTTTASQVELEDAKQLIATAKERLPKVRYYFKEGTNIFDYPGILQVGKIQLLPPKERDNGSIEYGYRLSLGLYLEDEFTRSSDFYIEFDGKGVITKVADIVASQ